MESEVSSKAPAAPRNLGLSTVYVPLNHKHHEQANVLYGIVGNPRDSLPPVDSRQYLDFFHRVMKARSPHPSSRPTHFASAVSSPTAPPLACDLTAIRAAAGFRTLPQMCPGAERALLCVTCGCPGRCMVVSNPRPAPPTPAVWSGAGHRFRRGAARRGEGHRQRGRSNAGHRRAGAPGASGPGPGELCAASATNISPGTDA